MPALSPDASEAAPALVETLKRHEQGWRAQPLLRRIYGDRHQRLARELAAVEGPTVELGAGLAQLRSLVPRLIVLEKVT